MLVPIYINSVGGFILKENEFNNKAMKKGNTVNLDVFGRKVSLDIIKPLIVYNGEETDFF